MLSSPPSKKIVDMSRVWSTIDAPEEGRTQHCQVIAFVPI